MFQIIFLLSLHSYKYCNSLNLTTLIQVSELNHAFILVLVLASRLYFTFSPDERDL